MHRIRSNLTYANVVATICLFLLLGTGAAFGAKKLINGSKIKPHTITGKQVKNGSLRAAVFKGGLPAGPTGPSGAAGVTGTRGPTGVQGVTGPMGSAKAWAQVSSTGTLLQGSGISFVVRPVLTPTGKYCISLDGGLTPENSVGLATLDYSAASTSSGDTVQVVNSSTTQNDCPFADEFEVRAYDSGPNLSDAGFTFMVP